MSTDPFNDEGQQARELTDRRLRRALERDRRRRRRRRRILGTLAGGACALVAGGVGYAVVSSGNAGTTPPAASPTTSPTAKARPAKTTPSPSRAAAHTSAVPAQHATTPAAPAAAAAPAVVTGPGGTRPLVYVQAGHEPPGEPGYLAQTGAAGGPFGSEEAFNLRLAAALEGDLRHAGVEAIHTPALVTPWGGRGAVFISLHFDAVGGSAGIGWAVDQPGRGENYYQGQGFGTAAPTPYPDSAAHRSARAVTLAVQQRSLELANDIATKFAPIYTPANGAQSVFGGVEPRTGNARMLYFYGYYRTNAQARVLIECGAAGADNAFLSQTGLIASSIDSGIVSYLRSTGQLS